MSLEETTKSFSNIKIRTPHTRAQVHSCPTPGFTWCDACTDAIFDRMPFQCTSHCGGSARRRDRVSGQ